jgi:hypothetical protein
MALFSCSLQILWLLASLIEFLKEEPRLKNWKTWELISIAVGTEIGSNYENLAKYWLCNKKFGVISLRGMIA